MSDSAGLANEHDHHDHEHHDHEHHDHDHHGHHSEHDHHSEHKHHDHEHHDHEHHDHDHHDHEHHDHEHHGEHEQSDPEQGAAVGAAQPTDADAQPAGEQDAAAGAPQATDAEAQHSAEQFAAEHDPATHDVAAGEEFRQDGDWTAEQAGGPQVWDADGNLVAEGPEAEGLVSSQAGSGTRRISELHEVRDGGYSVGSAAPIEDGAQPLGHPVKAWEDTKTFVTPEHPNYHDAEPHVWFTDADAARGAGFSPVD